MDRDVNIKIGSENLQTIQASETPPSACTVTNTTKNLLYPTHPLTPPSLSSNAPQTLSDIVSPFPIHLALAIALPSFPSPSPPSPQNRVGLPSHYSQPHSSSQITQTMPFNTRWTDTFIHELLHAPALRNLDGKTVRFTVATIGAVVVLIQMFKSADVKDEGAGQKKKTGEKGRDEEGE